jgi:arylsulfatase A-like enzyme
MIKKQFKNSKILISKDATLPSYFGAYNNKEYRTPNIDTLAKQGTIFLNHYAAAASTAMSFTSMFTGKYNFELKRESYTEVDEYSDETLFDLFSNAGYECHLMWSNNYIYMAEKYSKCYGKNTIHHNSIKFNQSAGPNVPLSIDGLKNNDELLKSTMSKIYHEIENISSDDRIFLWIHFPHVILGRNSYGGDLDVFDSFVGNMRLAFGDDNIYITADHGHMNGAKGKFVYAFDLYNFAIKIPLITPYIGHKTVEFNTSNTQLKDIVFYNIVNRTEYVFSDTAYYAQPHRKLAIIKDNFKYIYNKETKSEELFDLVFDPQENVNLINRFVYDNDRKTKLFLSGVIIHRQCINQSVIVDHKW